MYVFEIKIVDLEVCGGWKGVMLVHLVVVNTQETLDGRHDVREGGCERVSVRGKIRASSVGLYMTQKSLGKITPGPLRHLRGNELGLSNSRGGIDGLGTRMTTC